MDDDDNFSDNDNFPLWLVFHSKSGREYYYNTVTGRSQWSPPSTNDLLKNDDGTEQKNPWRIFQNKKGADYYYNTLSGESQWIEPKHPTKDEEMTSSPAKNENGLIMREGENEETTETTIIGQSQLVKPSPAPADKKRKNPGSKNKDKKNDLHCNGKWVLVRARNRNDYYINTVTGKVQWERPDIPEGIPGTEDDTKNAIQKTSLATISDRNGSSSTICNDKQLAPPGNSSYNSKTTNTKTDFIKSHIKEPSKEDDNRDTVKETPRDVISIDSGSSIISTDNGKQLAHTGSSPHKSKTKNTKIDFLQEEPSDAGVPSKEDDNKNTVKETPRDATSNGSVSSRSSMGDGKGLACNGANSYNVEASSEKIDFLQDDPSGMTFERRIALSMMNRYKWYNPKLGITMTADHFGLQNTKDEEESYDSEDKRNRFCDKNEDRGKNNNSKNVNDTLIDGHFRSTEIGHPVDVTPEDEDANLEEAWAYFEHVTLARYVVRNKEEENNTSCVSRLMTKLKSCFRKDAPLECAEPGENKFPTKLYHPFFTPHSQLGDFGIGCGIYFSTLRAFCILTFLAGLINIPNMMYYSSEAYGPSRGNTSIAELRPSAVCTDHEWVICTDCFASPSFPGDRVRFYNETNTTTGEFNNIPQIRFGRKNNCDAATLQNGMINLATLMFIAIGILVINKLMSMDEVAYDIDEQTAQDYSIVIENPPSDAHQPEEWKHFFESNFKDAHVTCCTIGVDNDLLIQDLFERRETMKALEMMVDPGTKLDMLTLAGVAAHIDQGRGAIAKLLKNVSPGIPELVAKIAVLNNRIRGLVQLTYPVTNVFITFETEKAQREVLKSLSVGKFQAWRNNSKKVANDSFLFRNEYVLDVAEPDEPNTIRWRYLNVNFVSRLKIQTLTAVATVIAITCVAVITFFVNRSSPTRAAIITSVTNVLFPIVGTILVGMEQHPSESDKQASLYWKIAFFRWANTVLVYTLIIPFNMMIDDKEGIIIRVRDLFFAEMTTSTILQLLDIGGYFSRHYSAPRGTTQDKMDLAMSGGVFDLAEKYTSMTKFLLLALWYSSIFPTGLFMCSLSMMINYYADRYSLMRSWKKPLNLGNEISVMNKKIFFPLCIFFMAFASSYFWSGFPYDNLCSQGTIGELNDYTSEYLSMGEFSNGTITNIPPHNYEDADSPEPNITTFHINNDTEVYEHCFQDLLRTTSRLTYPFVSSSQKEGNRWMTTEQELVTDIYGWTTFGIMIVLILVFVYNIGQKIRSFFVGTYEESGKDQGIDFSRVESISTYIPQVTSSVYPYPLLASNIDNIDAELLEWNDDDRPHAFYDLTLDARALTAGLSKNDENNENNIRETEARERAVFCQVAHWPPLDVKKSQ